MAAAFERELGALGGFVTLAMDGLKVTNQESPMGARLWFRSERLTSGEFRGLEAARGGVVVAPMFVRLSADVDAALGLARADDREISALFVVESSQLAVGDVGVTALGYARELVLPPLTAFEVLCVQRGAPRGGGAVGRAVVHLREVGLAGRAGAESGLRAEVQRLREEVAELRRGREESRAAAEAPKLGAGAGRRFTVRTGTGLRLASPGKELDDLFFAERSTSVFEFCGDAEWSAIREVGSSWVWVAGPNQPCSVFLGQDDGNPWERFRVEDGRRIRCLHGKMVVVNCDGRADVEPDGPDLQIEFV